MKLAINVMEMAVLCVRKQKQASLVANICILARSIKKKLGMRINVLSGGAIKI
jgi:enoyl-[acyl-carrier-protein] reductase (NADH)